MDQALLGYDLRLDAADYVSQRWNSESRESYLLRPEISWPLSVDTSVWPSVFAWQGQVPMPGAPAQQGAVEVRSRDFPRIALGLWPDQREMMARLREQADAALGAAKSTEIAVTVVDGESLYARNPWSALLVSEQRHRALPKDLALLGYDVADVSLLSGLSNCGLLEEERNSIRATFATHLNELGLFTSQDAARAFRGMTDRRVSEHSPFFVYGLYRTPAPLPDWS